MRAARNKANLRARLAERKLGRSKICTEKRAEVLDVTRDEHDTELDELMKELELAAESHVIRTRTSKRGRPYSGEFEDHYRFLMATGMSTKSCRDQMILNRNFMLKDDAKRDFVMPQLDWFKKLRESVGLHSWMHAMTRVAGADAIRQFGHDETSIDYVATFNQWCLMEEGGKLEVVVFEAGGSLVGGTAEEVSEHIQFTWERAQATMLMLREELGDKADELAPLRQGGMLLLKIESVMHDTCRTAKKVRPLLQERKGICGRQFYGEEERESFGPEKRKLHDYLCGNRPSRTMTTILRRSKICGKGGARSSPKPVPRNLREAASRGEINLPVHSRHARP